MTIQEMHIDIDLGLQRIASYINDDILPEELDRYINMSIEKHISTEFTQFELSQKNIDGLRTLIKSSEINSWFPNFTFLDGFKIDRVDIPTDYLYTISLYCNIRTTSANTSITEETVAERQERRIINSTDIRVVLGKKIQKDDILALMVDPFNKPDKENPLFTYAEGSIDIYTPFVSSSNGSICDKAYLTYIKKPAVVSLADEVDCDLPVAVHRKIVDDTVLLIMADQGKEVSQTKALTLSKN